MKEGYIVSKIANMATIMTIVTMMLFAGCIKNEFKAPPLETSTPTTAPATPTPTMQTPTSLSQINIPFWENAEDIEFFKRGEDEKVYVTEVTVELKPPFYPSTVPYKYKKYTPVPRGSGDVQIPIIYKYDDFNIFFIYKDEYLKQLGIPTGAMVLSFGPNRKADLHAEARFLEFIEQEQGSPWIKIEEVHYKDKKPIFYAKSIIKYMVDQKVEEIDAIGKKEKEYFFEYPTWSPRS